MTLSHARPISLAFALLFLSVRLSAAVPIEAEEMELVRRIRARLVSVPPEAKAYTQTIPGTTVTYSMVPIPAGEFRLGSPETEQGRQPDEGPQVTVRLPAFHMGRCEVTWNEYELFMFSLARGGDGAEAMADAVSHPTKPYVEMSFGMGRDGFPAISMTHHAANKYCQWLSARTGHFYRLPTEAEWEYAARAGTTTAYSCGDDPAALAAYAVYEAEKYAKVGSRRPNPWGLCDMHGNVWEWTLDQYQPDAYAHRPQSGWVPSTEPYPHVVRGGSWADGADRLRSAARRASDPAWKMLDPQLPKSIWYHTSALWLGFRMVRPRELPSAEEMYRMWNNGVALD